jgi:prepilin-type N-terminal cleavage/methylation domain-containing protein
VRAPARLRGRDGFTLLEVLIAFAILSIAIVSLIELTSQGLRLLRVSGDHQQAVQLADRIAMETQVVAEDVQAEAVLIDAGQDGNFLWERRIARLPLPEPLESRATIPGREVAGLYTVSVAVRWGRNQMVEVATLRAPVQVSNEAEAAAPESQTQGEQPGTGQPGRQSGGRGPGEAGGQPGGRSSGSSSPSGAGRSGPGASGSTGGLRSIR